MTQSPSPIANFAATADTVTAELGRLTEESMTRATPCEGWAVQDLTEHLVDNAYFFAGAAGAEASRQDPITPSSAATAYRSAADTVLSAYGAPGMLEQVLETPFGAFPGAMVLSVCFADQLTHVWDLARALGATPQVDDGLVAEAMGAWEAFIQGDLRDGPLFDPAKTAPDGASALDRLAAFTGRAVS